MRNEANKLFVINGRHISFCVDFFEAPGGWSLRFEDFAFGRIQVDGAVYDHDLVIDHGKIHKRKKQPSKEYRESFGHTPLNPWFLAKPPTREHSREERGRNRLLV